MSERRDLELVQSLLACKVMEHYLSVDDEFGRLDPNFPFEKWEEEFQPLAKEFHERSTADGNHSAFKVFDPILSRPYHLIIFREEGRFFYRLEPIPQIPKWESGDYDGPILED